MKTEAGDGKKRTGRSGGGEVQERAVQRSAVKKKKNQASGLWGVGLGVQGLVVKKIMA